MARYNINDPVNARLSNIELKLKQHTHDVSSLRQSDASDGDVLTWSDTDNAWVPAASAGGGGGGGPGPGGHPLTDGDKGDITVSSSGTVWNIDAGVVTTTELGGDITTAGKALLDDADATAQRTTLGLGTAATASSGDFAAASHTHAIADVINLQTTLDGKASSSHTHVIADVTGLQTTLDGKAASSHSHALSDITQSGATTGQVPTWSGSAWAPATPSAGGGGTQSFPMMKPLTNQWITNAITSTNFTTEVTTTSRLRLAPLVFKYATNINLVRIVVSTAGTGALFDAAIYGSDADGRPTGSPIWDVLGLSGATTGSRDTAVSLSFTAGQQIWVAYRSGTVACTTRATGLANMAPLDAVTTSAALEPIIEITSTQGGAWPNFTTNPVVAANFISDNMPTLFLRVA